MTGRESTGGNTPAEDPRQYEQQWDELSQKELLMGIFAELQQIRVSLQQPETDESEPMYQCEQCGETVPQSDLEAHAKRHNAHPELIADLFRRIEP